MGAPINRTAKTSLDGNLVPYATASSAKLKANDDVIYDYVDGLNSAQDTHAQSATLAHPDGSVKTAKIADGAITTTKIANGAVGMNQLATGLGASADVQAQFAKRGIDVTSAPYNAKGDGVTDDTAALQAAINAAVVNKIGTVRLPPGTYITSKPLYVWGAFNNENISITLTGDNLTTSIIKKNTHGTLNDGSLAASIDAILILANYDGNMTRDTGGQNISNLKLDGRINGSDTDRVEYSIYAKSSVCYTLVDNLILFTNTGIWFDTNYWQNQARNIVMYIKKSGFVMKATGTSNYLEKIAIYGATVIAFQLTGNYSSGTSLVTQHTSGTPYEITWGDWSFVGIGEEDSYGSLIMRTQESTVTMSGVTFFGVISAGSTVIKADSNSTINIEGGTIGLNRASAGKLYDVTINAKVKFNEVRLTDTYSQPSGTGGIETSTATLKSDYGTEISLFRGQNRPYIGIDRRRRKNIDYFNNTQKVPGRSIFLNCKDTPLTDSDGTDYQWIAQGNVGDIFFVDDPAKNGVLGWVVGSDTANVNGPLRECSFIPIPLSGGVGVTGTRPAWAVVGVQYFDTTLNKPVWCKTSSVYEVDTITVTAAATAAGNVTVTLNGTATNVAVLAGDSAATIAGKIAATAFAGWKPSVNGAAVTFTSTLGGTRSAPSYSAGTTGATGSAVVTTAGANPAWVDATGTTV